MMEVFGTSRLSWALLALLCLDGIIAVVAVVLGNIQAVVLCFAVSVALGAIWHTRKLESQKAFLSFLRDYNSEFRVDIAFAAIRGGENYSALDDNQKSAVKYLLNQFEILAVGLASGIYDRKMVEIVFGFDLKRIYKKAEPYIAAIRKDDGDDDDESYAEFQKLAESVSKKMGFSNRGK